MQDSVHANRAGRGGKGKFVPGPFVHGCPSLPQVLPSSYDKCMMGFKMLRVDTLDASQPASCPAALLFEL